MNPNILAPEFDDSQNGAENSSSQLFTSRNVRNGEGMYPSNVVLVTPKLAAEWLETSVKNRPVSMYTIEKYARIMKRGEWRPNKLCSIGISKTGHLLNGHHRLQAVCLANVPVYMTVVYDADDKDFDIVDNGKKRSLADIFALEGIKNAHNIASIVTRYIKLCEGKVLRLRGNGGIDGSPDLYLDYLDEYYSCNNPIGDENLYQTAQKFSYNLVMNKNSMKMLSVTDIGAIYVFLVKRKQHAVTLVETFFDLLYNGGSQNLLLQNLASQLNADYSALKKMPSIMKQSLIAKAWNMYLRGSKARSVHIHIGEKVEFN